MNRKYLFCMLIFVLSLTISSADIANSNGFARNTSSLQKADEFYKNHVDKNVYEEFMDSTLNVRKLMMVKDLPTVFDGKEWKNYPLAWKEHLKKASSGNTKDLHPEQPVFYYFSLKEDSKKIHIKFAMYDANMKKIRSQGGGHWTKEEFKRKFVQK